MPDDQIIPGTEKTMQTLKELVPPVLMAFGAISLLRTSRLLTIVALGALLYDTAADVDAARKARGRSLPLRRAAGLRLDEEIEDSFPASDPPSSSGSMTAGAPS